VGGGAVSRYRAALLTTATNGMRLLVRVDDFDEAAVNGMCL
jgi:hypothetical protein